MADPRKEFEAALMAVRVASRYAMEFDSKAEMDSYLKEHPDADRNNHSVKKQAPKPKGGKKPAMKGKSIGADKPISDWSPTDYEKFLKQFTYEDVRPMSEIFKNKEDIAAIEQGMPKKLRKNFDYYKGVREKRWPEFKNTERGKALRTKEKAAPKSEPESKSDDSKKSDPFAPGGKFDSEQKPSSKEYVAAVEDALVSKRKWGWNDKNEVKDFMSKFNKLDQSEKNEFAWRLIEEEHAPEELAQEFFSKSK